MLNKKQTMMNAPATVIRNEHRPTTAELRPCTISIGVPSGGIPSMNRKIQISCLQIQIGYKLFHLHYSYMKNYKSLAPVYQILTDRVREENAFTNTLQPH